MATVASPFLPIIDASHLSNPHKLLHRDKICIYTTKKNQTVLQFPGISWISKWIRVSGIVVNSLDLVFSKRWMTQSVMDTVLTSTIPGYNVPQCTIQCIKLYNIRLY